MDTYQERGGRPKKRNRTEGIPHFLSDRLLKALFVNHRDLVPRELEARLLPIRIPQPDDQVKIKRNVFKNKPKPFVICLPDMSAEPPGPALIHTWMMQRAKQIVREVCDANGVSMGSFLGSDRDRRLVRTRREACYRLVSETNISIADIGRLIKKDHTTVIYAVNKHCVEQGLIHPRRERNVTSRNRESISR